MTDPQSHKGAAHLPHPPEAAPLALADAPVGCRFHLASLGESRADRLELMAAGLSLDSAVEVLEGCGRRPRVVACGQVRAAIGHDLAGRVCLRRCGPHCSCRKDPPDELQ